MRIKLAPAEMEKSVQRLEAFLQERGFAIAHDEALELSARLLGFENWERCRGERSQPLSPLDQDLSEAELARRDRLQMDVLEREGYGEIADELLDRVDPTGSWQNVFPEHEGFYPLRRQPRLRIAYRRSTSEQNV